MVSASFALPVESTRYPASPSARFRNCWMDTSSSTKSSRMEAAPRIKTLHLRVGCMGSDAVRKAIYPDPGGEADARFERYAVRTPIKSQQDGEKYVTGFIAACSSDLGREIDPEAWRIIGGKTH